MTQFNWSFLRACFLAGLAGTIVTYLVAPQLWWVGLLVGFAVGYLGHEFRETLRVLHSALRTSPTAIAEFIREAAKEVRRQDAPTNIVLASALLTTAVLATAIILDTFEGQDFYYWAAIMVALPLFLLWITLFGFGLSIALLLHLGARVAAREYWTDESNFHIWRFGGTKDFEKAKENGWKLKRLNYANSIRWTLLGVGVVVWFFLFYWWYWTITKGIPEAIMLGWDVVKRIHSHERVLCGIDGIAGVAIAYLIFKDAFIGIGIASPIAVVVVGGLSGAVFGTLHWRLARHFLRS